MTEIASDDKQHLNGASLVVRLSLLRIDPCKTTIGKLGVLNDKCLDKCVNKNILFNKDCAQAEQNLRGKTQTD